MDSLYEVKGPAGAMALGDEVDGESTEAVGPPTGRDGRYIPGRIHVHGAAEKFQLSRTAAMPSSW